MKTLGLAAVVAAMVLALPVAAAESSEQETASSGGVISWLADAVGISSSADQTVSDKKEPAVTEAVKDPVEPKPMNVPDDGPTDKDSYKPDAGEAPQ